jgi:Tfp pilus assembly protein PilO
MKRQRFAFLLLLAAILLSAILCFFYAKSTFSSIKYLRASIEDFQKKSRMDLEKSAGGAQELKELFPEEGDIAGFIEDVYGVSKQSGIRNLTFEQERTEFVDMGSGRILKSIPFSGNKTKVLYAYPVKFGFASGYRNMAEFVRGIQNLKRLVTIRSLTAKRDIDHLSVDMVVTVYSMGEK